MNDNIELKIGDKLYYKEDYVVEKKYSDGFIDKSSIDVYKYITLTEESKTKISGGGLSFEKNQTSKIFYDTTKTFLFRVFSDEIDARANITFAHEFFKDILEDQWNTDIETLIKINDILKASSVIKKIKEIY